MSASTEQTERQVFPKVLEGVVEKTVLGCTITVKTESKEPHPVYGKYVAKSKKFLVHKLEGMEVSVGDYVTIESCKPISKRKNFVLKDIIRKTETV